MFRFFKRALLGATPVTPEQVTSDPFDYPEGAPEMPGDDGTELLAPDAGDMTPEAEVAPAVSDPEGSGIEPGVPDAEVDADDEVETPIPEVEAVDADAETPDSAAPRSGTRFEEIEISPVAAADPVIMGLNPKLRMKPVALDPSEYTLFRTIAENTGYFDDDHRKDAALSRRLRRGGHDPEEEKRQVFNRREIALSKAEEEYAAYIETSRMFVSRENQIPGFRRLVLMGTAHFGGRKSDVLMAGVLDDGRVAWNRIRADDPRKTAPLASVGEALEVIRHGKDGWSITPAGRERFELNRHSRHAKAQPAKVVRDFCSHIGSMKTRMRAFHTLRSRADSRLNLARWAITQAMDPEILRTMRGTGLTKLSDAAWFSGLDEATEPDAEGHSQRNALSRLQAVRSYPILARDLLQEQDLTYAIDTRTPLAPVLADHLCVEERELKALQGLTWQMAGATPRDTQPVVTRLLGVPQEYRPSGRAEHRGLGMIETFGKTLYGEGLSETLHRLAQGGSPYRHLEKLKDNPPGDIKDAVSYLARKLYVPVALNRVRMEAETKGLSWEESHAGNRHLDDKARAAIVAAFKPKELFELNERYHRNIQRFEDRIEKLEDGSNWHAFAGHLDLTDGVRARELSSTHDLKAQGRDQNHCVGGYASKVVNGTLRSATVIFSLEQDGRVLGTCELRLQRAHVENLTEDGDIERTPCIDVTVAQHRAYSNGEPGQAAQLAAKGLRETIAAMPVAALEGYIERLEANRRADAVRNEMPAVVREAGYDVWHRPHLEDAWAELSAVLPRAIRKKGLDALIASADITRQRFHTTIGEDAKNPWDIDYADELARANEAARAYPEEEQHVPADETDDLDDLEWDEMPAPF